MSHRSNGPDATSGHTKAIQPAARALSRPSVRNSVSSTMNATQHRLTLLGVSSIALVALLYARPDNGMQSAPATSPAVVQTVAAPAQVAVAAPEASDAAAPKESAQAGSHRQQQAVTSWLSK